MTGNLANTLEKANELREQGRYADAEAVLLSLIARVDHECRPASVAAAQVSNAHGLLLKATGRYHEARARYREAFSIMKFSGFSDELATLYHNLAGIDFVLGDLTQALAWGRRGLELRRTLAGPDDLAVLLDEGNLAPILIAAGGLDEAENLLSHVHAQLLVQRDRDDYEIAVTLTNLGALAAHRGDLPVALSSLTEAARIKSAELGPEHPELIRTLLNIAVVAEKLGELDHSRQAHAQALSIARATLPPDHQLRLTLENW
ncbi:hypothetical protein Acy02nite_81910 [Actinoplanes cyaneus]|uniref:Tetratricopeptide repeat protein n=1 Tax=Actinoplanes cyaneus TaxID=52696 RepID=A0A919M5D1_9ACTN|nr:tetratricopeptide repeat protein [Actinoplanes cyaneus]MCW2143458.1 Tetratricopeptide repeat-containing protein [Actinoplanes cyaneus]GID70310.1 hypothetical protein Acy02nite_81910 [Actinoplanes cyaneus]